LRAERVWAKVPSVNYIGGRAYLIVAEQRRAVLGKRTCWARTRPYQRPVVTFSACLLTAPRRRNDSDTVHLPLPQPHACGLTGAGTEGLEIDQKHAKLEKAASLDGCDRRLVEKDTSNLAIEHNLDEISCAN